MPASVVQRGPQGTFAYVVAPDQTVSIRPVEVDSTQEQLSVVARGLVEGDRVVVEGQSQLRPGAKVAARPEASARRRASARPAASTTLRPKGAGEHFRAVHSASGRNDAADVRAASWRVGCFPAAPHLGAAAGRLPHHRRIDVLPGASPETMASAVTTPLERQFGQMPALSQMTSVSSFGSSQITLQFDLDRNIDAAEQDVQAAINAAANLCRARCRRRRATARAIPPTRRFSCSA